jgi:hypothetical protein
MKYQARTRLEKISAKARHLEESAWANPEKLFETQRKPKNNQTTEAIAAANRMVNEQGKDEKRRGGKLGMFVLFEALALILMR